MTLAEVFYRNVRAVRHAKSLSGPECSRRAGRGRNWWINIAEGRSGTPSHSGPTLTTIETVAGVLDIDAMHLLNPDLRVHATHTVTFESGDEKGGA